MIVSAWVLVLCRRGRCVASTIVHGNVSADGNDNTPSLPPNKVRVFRQIENQISVFLCIVHTPPAGDLSHGCLVMTDTLLTIYVLRVAASTSSRVCESLGIDMGTRS